MIDWNGDGKVDGFETMLTLELLEDDDDGGKAPVGCCGPAVAMLLLLSGAMGALVHLLIV